MEMHHAGHGDAGTYTDPVCGMSVNQEVATAKGLVAEHEGTTYYFCGKGCMLDFNDEPQHFLDPEYVPHM